MRSLLYVFVFGLCIPSFHLNIHSPASSFLSHNSCQTWTVKSNTSFFKSVHAIPSFRPIPHVALQGNVTHSGETAICPLQITWPHNHTWDWLVSPWLTGILPTQTACPILLASWIYDNRKLQCLQGQYTEAQGQRDNLDMVSLGSSWTLALFHSREISCHTASL